MWPQIVFLFLLASGFGICIANFGKPRTGEYGFAYTFVSPALTLWLLYEGGFFKVMGWAP